MKPLINLFYLMLLFIQVNCIVQVKKYKKKVLLSISMHCLVILLYCEFIMSNDLLK
jgi:hypothetical protein